MLLDKEKRVNAIREKEDQLTNQRAAYILLDVARTLSRKGLAFRGSSTHEHGENDGNFYQIVQLVSRHCPRLKKWLSDVSLRPYHVTYMSPESQNEVIEILESCFRSVNKKSKVRRCFLLWLIQLRIHSIRIDFLCR